MMGENGKKLDKSLVDLDNDEGFEHLGGLNFLTVLYNFF